VTTSAGPGSADELRAYAPVPRSALGPALNEQGYYVGRVERNLLGHRRVYQSAFLVTPDGVVLFDAPPASATTCGGLSTRSPPQRASATP